MRLFLTRVAKKYAAMSDARKKTRRQNACQFPKRIGSDWIFTRGVCEKTHHVMQNTENGGIQNTKKARGLAFWTKM